MNTRWTMMAFAVLTFSAAFALLADEQAKFTAPIRDTPFRQAISVKYTNKPDLAGAVFRKMVIDYRDNVFVLTDQGLYRNFSGTRFGGDFLAKDYSYASLTDKIPVDITTQSATGYLYYLYEDGFLTNAHAGTIYGHFEPGKFHTIRVNAADTILLIGDTAASLYQRNEKAADVQSPPSDTCQLFCWQNDFFALTPNHLLKLDGTSWKTVFSAEKMTCAAADDERILVGTKNGIFEANYDGAIVKPLNNRIPIPNVTHAIFSGTRLWFGSDLGVFTAEPDRWRYFAGERWLDSDRVIDMKADSNGNIFILSDSGLNEIRYKELTLAQKAATIQEEIEKYHNRFGWSSAARLIDPDDPTTISLRDNDNDGLWTSIYLGSQAFRYAVTNDESARRNVWEAFEAFERNLAIHGLDGFSARTFERKGYINSDPKAWRDAPEDDWVWKGTTSTDEVVGYIFVTDLIDRLVAKTPEEKKRVADYFDAILAHVVRNNYYMIDYDGKPTLWARWNAEYVNQYPRNVFDRKLNSVLITAMLRLGHRLTGNEFYHNEMRRLWDEWGYHDNMLIPMTEMRYTDQHTYRGHEIGRVWNHSDDEMAFLTYYTLYHASGDDEGRLECETIVADHWEIERPEKNALWNVISYACCGRIDRDATVWWLREFNLDRRDWKMTNSHRNDLSYRPVQLSENFRQQLTDELLTQGEMRIMRHNANGFDLDGGSAGDYVLTGEEFLLPYWMCRYYGVIE